MRALFVTSEDILPGFRLAGFTQISSSAEEVTTRLEQIFQTKEAALVIVDERLLTTREIRRRFDELALASPVQVATLPVSTAAEEDSYARRMIVKTIGYSLQL